MTVVRTLIQRVAILQLLTTLLEIISFDAAFLMLYITKFSLICRMISVSANVQC